MAMDAVNTSNAAYSAKVRPAVETVSYSVGEAAPVQQTQVVVEPATEKRGGSEQPEKREVSSDEIKKAIARANKKAHFGHTNAEFSYHEPTKRISVKIVDKDTNEVIKEIPPEETLEMISKMWELAGLMVDEKR